MPRCTRLSAFAHRSVKAVRDAGEHGVQTVADVIHRRHDNNGNPARNKRVFDGSGTGLIDEKPSDLATHVLATPDCPRDLP